MKEELCTVSQTLFYIYIPFQVAAYLDSTNELTVYSVSPNPCIFSLLTPFILALGSP